MKPDILIVGAGLSGSLAAIACAQRHPGIKLLLIDAANGPGDQQTWSFHDADISREWHERLAPGLRARWPCQEVRFQGFYRELPIGYNTLDGAGLDRLRKAAGIKVRWHSPVKALSATGAVLQNGERLDAPCVIDARGTAPSKHLVTGYQKFLGIEIETTAPHALEAPVIMDASVDQIDGYRFIYLLPFTATRILIEDTRYSDDPELQPTELTDAIWAYAARMGWRGHAQRTERGVLPITLAFDAAGFWREAQGGPVPIGMGAGMFHPVTGYSLPDAVRVADIVAKGRLDTGSLFAAVSQVALSKANDDRFLRLLNRMLFRGCAPDQRHKVLARFYRLPQGIIERFYAGRLTRLDRARIVAGKPPISLRKAIGCLAEKPVLRELP